MLSRTPRFWSVCFDGRTPHRTSALPKARRSNDLAEYWFFLNEFRHCGTGNPAAGHRDFETMEIRRRKRSLPMLVVEVGCMLTRQLGRAGPVGARYGIGLFLVHFALTRSWPNRGGVVDGIWGDLHPQQGCSFPYRSNQWALGQLQTLARCTGATGRDAL